MYLDVNDMWGTYRTYDDILHTYNIVYQYNACNYFNTS